jgi:hypothetical protein
MLDMTPGFGNVTTQLVDGIAYLSFILPYRDRNTFVAQWEDEKSLKRSILQRTFTGSRSRTLPAISCNTR